jgi:hypothetical protein
VGGFSGGHGDASTGAGRSRNGDASEARSLHPSTLPAGVLSSHDLSSTPGTADGAERASGSGVPLGRRRGTGRPGEAHLRGVVDVLKVEWCDDAQRLAGDLEVPGHGACHLAVQRDVEWLV